MSTSRSLLIIIASFICLALIIPGKTLVKSEMTSNSVLSAKEAGLQRLRQQAATILPFIKSNQFNSNVCFLIDMNISSGKKRFFIYDLVGDTVLSQGLVAHGSCDAGFQVAPTFSNKINSGCSATGRYKIGKSYQGNFGLAYKLHGLDASNSNAFSRNIVLHSYSCVPDEETDPLALCNSRGCPMVSPNFLARLKPVIDKSSKPILLWIYQ